MKLQKQKTKKKANGNNNDNKRFLIALLRHRYEKEGSPCPGERGSRYRPDTRLGRPGASSPSPLSSPSPPSTASPVATVAV